MKITVETIKATEYFTERFKDMPVYSIVLTNPTYDEGICPYDRKKYGNSLENWVEICESIFGDDFCFIESFVHNNNDYMRVIVCKHSDYLAIKEGKEIDFKEKEKIARNLAWNIVDCSEYGYYACGVEEWDKCCQSLYDSLIVYSKEELENIDRFIFNSCDDPQPDDIGLHTVRIELICTRQNKGWLPQRWFYDKYVMKLL